ncbi:hypothetical protein GCM10023196_067210 [Actinoallomurus vinaceus]|uniref:Uncharacterized protein n=1 Tax=Actinoallomurus vinaceus TaxID=1080074 RepID=A0ABP8UIC2_9ACTN
MTVVFAGLEPALSLVGQRADVPAGVVACRATAPVEVLDALVAGLLERCVAVAHLWADKLREEADRVRAEPATVPSAVALQTASPVTP